MLQNMNIPRIHPPSLLLGALLSLGLAAASTGDGAAPVSAPASEPSAQHAPGANPWQLVVSENNGRRYLLESATGRLFHHEGERWVLAAPAPE